MSTSATRSAAPWRRVRGRCWLWMPARGAGGSRVPPPRGDVEAPLRALIFDSHYDSYKGVIAYVRVVEGSVAPTDEIRMLATAAQTKPLEIGYFAPAMAPAERLSAGEVGYIATGLKTVRECRVGDTIASATDVGARPLPGYEHPKPMVFAGFYPVDGDDYPHLHDAPP